MASKRRLLGTAQLQQLDENEVPNPAPKDPQASSKQKPAFRALAYTLKQSAAAAKSASQVTVAPVPATQQSSSVAESAPLPTPAPSAPSVSATPIVVAKTSVPDAVVPPVAATPAPPITTPALVRSASIPAEAPAASHQLPSTNKKQDAAQIAPAEKAPADLLLTRTASLPTPLVPAKSSSLSSSSPSVAVCAPPSASATSTAASIKTNNPPVRSAGELAAELSSAAKREYNGLVLAAKDAENKGDIGQAVQLLERAAAIAPLAGIMKRLARLRPLAEEAAMEKTDDGWFVARINKRAVAYVTSAGSPAQHLRVAVEHYEKMLPHQRAGVVWLWRRHVEGERAAEAEAGDEGDSGKRNSDNGDEMSIGGGVLADDMGLGKTIQVTVFLAALFRARLTRNALLLLPLSVMDNWRSELEKWAPETNVCKYHGSKSQRDAALRSVHSGGVCLSTYGMVLTSCEALSAEKWDYVVLDEGHKIKNPGIKLSKALPAISSRHRLVLTGSPLQNNLLELWALFDYACAGRLLGSRAQFVRHWEAPISVAHDRAATRAQIEEGHRLAAELRSVIAPYFLRREKRDVFPEQHGDASAPSASSALSLRVRKNDFIVWLPPCAAQMRVYEAFLSSDQVAATLNRSASPLAAITVLKKICDHPRLLGEALPDLGIRDTKSTNDVQALVAHSSKLQFLLALLPELHQGGHRVLLFSQSRLMLDLIQTLVASLKLRYTRIDGTINKVSERQRRIDEFNADPNIFAFLLTTGVGGLGINLTSADRVVIFDPAWSPIDNQAVDRVYRIGQKRDVVIYRLITCGTIEEKIYGKQVFKGALFETVANQPGAMASMSLGGGSHRYFTGSELRALFTLGSVNESATQKQLHALHAKFRRSDAQLDAHIAWLEHRCAGISDHNLLYADAPAIDDVAEEGDEARFFGSRPIDKPRQTRKVIEDEDEKKSKDKMEKKNNKKLKEEEDEEEEEEEKEEEAEDDKEKQDDEKESDISAVVRDAEDLGAANLSHLYHDPTSFLSTAPASLLDAAQCSAYNALVEKTNQGNTLEALSAALEALALCDEDQHLHRRAIRIAAALKLLPVQG